MRLYKYICGTDEKVGFAEDDKDAYERRAQVDPTFYYLPVTIAELTLPGYVIEIRPVDETPVTELPTDSYTVRAVDAYDDWDRPTLRSFLDDNGIEYTPNWGDKRLRETIRAWIAAKRGDACNGAVS